MVCVVAREGAYMPQLAMGDACGLVRTRLSHLASRTYMLSCVGLYALSLMFLTGPQLLDRGARGKSSPVIHAN